MVENKASKEAQHQIYNWKLKEDRRNKTKSGIETISTLRNPEKNQLKLRCENCTAQSKHCVCQSTVLKPENVYEARVLMTKDLPTESKEDKIITQQVTACQILTLNTNKFYCDFPNNSTWIEAQKRCDGEKNCKNNSDEENCQNTLLKKKLLLPLFGIFLSATIAGTIACSLWQKCGCGKKNIGDQQPDSKICKALRLLHYYNASPEPKNQKEVRKQINKLSYQEQFILLQITKNISMKKEDGLYKAAVENLFRKKNSSESGNRRILKKFKLMISQTRFKAEIVTQAENSWLTKTKEKLGFNKYLCQRPSALNDCKEVMNLLLSISMTAKRTIFLFLQEAKTLTLLITLHHFYTEILQGRTNQIDNIQLYETWLFLTILYVGHSILKQISKARIPLSTNKMIKLLQVFPFFTECFLLLKIIGCKVKMYKLKRAIQKKIDNISKTDTTSNNWKLIGKESLKLSKLKKEIEEKNVILAKVDAHKTLFNAIQGNTLSSPTPDILI